MTPNQVRMANPILGSLMLAGAVQSPMAAQALFPRLPVALRGFQLASLGDAATRAYNTRRAPGAATKQVKISWQGQTYTVAQHAIDVPIPRELIQEADEARRLNVGANAAISQIAVNTALQILNLDYELEAAAIATDATPYASNTRTYDNSSGKYKWSHASGTPVSDIAAAANTIRSGTGRRPNTLLVSAVAFGALQLNKEVQSYLTGAGGVKGPATMEQLKAILKVSNIVVGEAIWTNEAGTTDDVWGNNAILAYVPPIGPEGTGLALGEPAYGFTSWMDGHPMVETPYYQRETKSWIYGATFERTPTLVRAGAGFLFKNPN